MASPSPLQLFVLIVCGAALATFSCFQVSGSEIDAGSIGLMLGILIIGYVAVRLFVRPSSAPASAPESAFEPASAPPPLAPAGTRGSLGLKARYGSASIETERSCRSIRTPAPFCARSNRIDSSPA